MEEDEDCARYTDLLFFVQGVGKFYSSKKKHIITTQTVSNSPLGVMSAVVTWLLSCGRSTSVCWTRVVLWRGKGLR